MTARSETLYLDHAATVPMRPEVRAAAARCAEQQLGNPSSAHSWGRRAKRRLEEARAAVAEALGAPTDHVFFTRGGTESNNLAVLGRVRRRTANGASGAVVVTSPVEHPAVLEAARQAEAEGAVHRTLKMDGGVLDLDALDDVLDARPVVVSCMWVNNEIGWRLPVEEVALRCRSRGVPFHCDAVQALGKVPLSLAEVPVSSLAIAGHKIYGPPGTGALVTGDPQALLPLHQGGGQEGGLRPGTEDVVGAVGLAEAVRLAVAEQPAESARLEAMRDEVEARLLAARDGLRAYGPELPRAPHILSLGVPGADSDTLLAALDAHGVAASGGSACASGSRAPSPTLAALYPEEDAAVVRLSFGRLVRMRQAKAAAEVVAGVIRRACEVLAR